MTVRWDRFLQMLARVWQEGNPKDINFHAAQKHYIVGSLGPKALIYESLEPQGNLALAIEDASFRKP